MIVLRRAAVIGLGAVISLPIVVLVISAFSQEWRFPQLVPTMWTVRAIGEYSGGPSAVARAASTSLVVALLVTLLACLVSYPAARVLGMQQFRGRRAFALLLVAPAVVPTLAVILGLQIFFIRIGLSDTLVGVVVVQVLPALPYVVFIMTGAFANFDRGYESQARALGAPWWRVLWSVTLPIQRPALLVAALFGFLVSWNEYVLTLVVGGGQVKTLPIELFAAIQASDTMVAASLAVVLITPPIAATLLAARIVSKHATLSVSVGDT